MGLSVITIATGSSTGEVGANHHNNALISREGAVLHPEEPA